ncbi:hypothetical protein QMK19_19220 [Streptomyces sp. H10-C2]|nr:MULTISPECIES: hypothetical protein [unclassified Streptomyces]MDJ0346237.1 hypothetical protein [Streptomyces sp. PH10-H1]MDJ0371752.1 hypothetical protein [Streptomyces sp. H10-C2]
MSSTTSGRSQSADSSKPQPSPEPVQRSDSAQCAHRRFMQLSKW